MISNSHLHPPMLRFKGSNNNQKHNRWHHDFTKKTTLSHMNFKPWNTHPHVPLDIGSALLPSDGLMEEVGQGRWPKGFGVVDVFVASLKSKFFGPKRDSQKFFIRFLMKKYYGFCKFLHDNCPLPIFWSGENIMKNFLHLWAVDWCQKSLASFWWGYTLEMLR